MLIVNMNVREWRKRLAAKHPWIGLILEHADQLRFERKDRLVIRFPGTKAVAAYLCWHYRAWIYRGAFEQGLDPVIEIWCGGARIDHC